MNENDSEREEAIKKWMYEEIDLRRKAHKIYLDSEEQRCECYKAQKEYWELMKKKLEEV